MIILYLIYTGYAGMLWWSQTEFETLVDNEALVIFSYSSGLGLRVLMYSVIATFTYTYSHK